MGNAQKANLSLAPLTISMAQASAQLHPSGSRIRVSNWITCALSDEHACTPLMFSLRRLHP
ncbi:hypothetical protein LNP74_19740 [Klebsiella pneumoniae subsp. pneumoniae]|nr:hypothetical protein [Klebsiella pneumoniae subsp. pneumoniae]